MCKPKQLQIAFLCARGDVSGGGGALAEVVGSRYAAHGAVEVGAAVAAVNIYGLAICFTQRVKHIFHKRGEVALYLPVGPVAYAFVMRGCGISQLSYAKILHLQN